MEYMGLPGNAAKERKALIVGGTGDIGRAICLSLADEGIELTIHGGHDKGKLDSLCRVIADKGKTVRGIIKKIEKAEDLLDEIKPFLPFDIVVVTFGPFLKNSMADTDSNVWRKMAELNYILPAMLISFCLPSMLKKKYGRFILFGGTGTEIIQGYRTTSAYSAVKTALGVLAKSVALACNGITCNVIAPGFIKTRQYASADIEKISASIPAGRFGEPDEVAELVRYLVSSSGDYINGAILPIHGGIRF
ncbi:MAG: SDR family oxidoreductase [Spirochaetes bacterium]|nr:SDR family oxidoreductase [Spirochaetota bacterium]